MDVIWYAVRCKAGMEQQTAEEWNQRHDGKACRAFIITYEKMKRYEGSWHLICEPLLSGYFFLKTEESKVLEEAQDSIPIDSGRTVSEGVGWKRPSRTHVTGIYQRRENLRDRRAALWA